MCVAADSYIILHTSYLLLFLRRGRRWEGGNKCGVAVEIEIAPVFFHIKKASGRNGIGFELGQLPAARVSVEIKVIGERGQVRKGYCDDGGAIEIANRHPGRHAN